MKVKIIEEKELCKPELKISMDLETGVNIIILEHTCPECSGWGCRRHGGTGGDPRCNGGTIYHDIKPQDLLKTLGPEFKTAFLKLKDAIFDTQEVPIPKSEKKSYLVSQSQMTGKNKDWVLELHKLAITVTGEILIRNILSSADVAVVDATDIGVDFLRENGFRVEPNGIKKI